MNREWRQMLEELAHGPRTGQKLTRALGFPTFARARRMEERGWLRRTYPSGARTIHWELTQAGRDALKENE